MDRQTQILNKQSLIDIAIQATGSIEGVFELALMNNLSVTQKLEVSQKILTVEPINKQIKEYYQSSGIYPATDMMEDEGIFDNTFDLTFN